MYDIQIIVTCCKDRLSYFQKFGLYNIQDKKVLLYCLCFDKKEFQEGWPKGIDVVLVDDHKNDIAYKEIILNGNKNYSEEIPHNYDDLNNLEKNWTEYEKYLKKDYSDDASFKLYNFLYNLKHEDCMLAKWTLKIDDDSYNDISLMVNYLERNFDYTEVNYLTSELKVDNNLLERSLLNKLNLWNKAKDYKHEVEACWLSRKALCKINKDKDCKRLFREKSILSLKMGGWTDQCLGAACKICKIHPVKEDRAASDWRHITKNIKNTSLFGDSLFHYHPFCNINLEKIKSQNNNIIL